MNNKRSAFSTQSANSNDDIQPQAGSDHGGFEKPGIHKPDPIDISKVPSKIKIDLTTPLEYSWWYLAIAAGIVLLLIVHYASGTKNTPPNPGLYKYTSIPIAFMALFYILRQFTNNYYIMDTGKRKIYFHYEFLGNVKITEYIDFNDIMAIGVTGVRHHHKNSHWWDYHIFMADKNGKITDLSDPAKETDLASLNSRAFGMASVAQCQFANAGKQTQVTIQTYAGERFGLAYESFNDFEGWSQLDDALKRRIIVLVVIGILLVIFMCISLPVFLKSTN